MGKLFAILLIVLGIWVGMTIFTEGTDRAFGGLFAGLSGAEPADARAPLERIEDKARAAREQQVQRLERQLGEGVLDEEP